MRIELASRLGFPAFTYTDGARKFRDYPDFITRYETEPGSGIGFLAGWRGKDSEKFMQGDPIVIQIYSEVLQKFRLAAQGKGASRKRPPAHLKERIETYFNPLPFYYAPLETQANNAAKYPLAAIPLDCGRDCR